MHNSVTGHPGFFFSPSAYITELEFADDGIVLGDSLTTMQTTLDRITLYAEKADLEINTNKTKAFSIFPIPGAQKLSMNGEQIENVSSFKYLGSILLPNEQAEDKITMTINSTHRAFL